MQINLSKRTVVIIGTVFGLLLIAGFWWKLNPSFNKKSYYQDAARLQKQEADMDETGKQKPRPPELQGRSSDRMYQPESGN